MPAFRFRQSGTQSTLRGGTTFEAPVSAAAAFPDVIVEIAFATAPLAATPTWTDVTQWARHIHIQRGKSHELSQQQPGTCTILLDNRDRRFDPTNTSNPYSPNVLPMKKLRVSATWAGGTYYLFTGYVEAWPLKWADPVNDDVEVTTVDGLKILNGRRIVGSAYRAAVLADTPVHYWPFYDAVGSSAAADIGSSPSAGTYTGTVTLGVDGANPADSDTAVYQSTTGQVQMVSGASISGTGDFTIEMWFKQDSSTVTRSAHLMTANVGAGSFSLNILSDGKIQLVAEDGSLNGGSLTSTAATAADQWVHVAAVKIGTTGPANWNMYINGALSNGSTTLFGTGNCNLPAGAFAFAGLWNGSTFSNSFAGAMQHAAFYSSALNSTQVSTHYNTTSGFTTAVLTGTRIGKVLDEVDWPAADRVLDAGQFSMQAVTKPFGTTTVLAYVQNLLDSEGYPADAFIDGQGRFVFQDRAHATPASAATFGDGAAELPYELGGTTAPTLDDLSIINEVSLTANNGQAQISTDSTSQTNYGIRTLSKSGLQNASDSDVATVAAAIITRYKTPSTRLAALAIHPLDDPTDLFPQVLGRELNDRITVHRTFFAGGGSQFSLDVRIEGITHDITPFEWHTTWQLAPT